MEINNYDSVLIYHRLTKALENNRLDCVQNLNQTDRKIIFQALHNLNAPTSSAATSTKNVLSTAEVTDLINRIEQPPQQQKSIILRVCHTLANVLGLRLSSHQIIEKFRHLKYAHEALIKNVDKIHQQIEPLQGINEFMAFRRTKALPEYAKFTTFYRELLKNPEEAKNLLSQKTTELEQEIIKAKSENEDPDLIKILEKEFLASATKLLACQSTTFKRELELSLQVFQKAEEGCRTLSYENQAVNEIQTKIQHLAHEYRQALDNYAPLIEIEKKMLSNAWDRLQNELSQKMLDEDIPQPEIHSTEKLIQFLKTHQELISPELLTEFSSILAVDFEKKNPHLR